MATKRKAISKKTRFEVFKRDGFKCQYCGAASPEAVLVVDHIDPVSKNGAHDMMNFITACQPCNAGKSDRTLDDNSTLQKQRAQLDELNVRREQLEMMLQWRNGLKSIAEDEVEHIEAAWDDATEGAYHLNDRGLKTAKKMLKEHGLQKVLDAIDTAKLNYIKKDSGGAIDGASVETAWNKVGGILRIGALPEDKRRLHYVKGILRNRLSYVPFDIMKDLDRAHEAGVHVDDMQAEAKCCRNWSAFNQWLVQAEKG